MKKEQVILRRKEPVSFNGKKWTYQETEFEVIVMAVADGFAMVRRPGCMPFVVDEKQLTRRVK